MITITDTWRVGKRYRVEMTIGTDDRGEPRLCAEWTPRVPERLTQREVAAYQRGRDALVSRFAEQAGIASVVIVES